MTSREVRAELKKQFPSLRHSWLTDPNYQAPSFDALIRRVEMLWPSDEYKSTVNECEEFALYLMADVRKEDFDQAANWPFGLCFAKQLNGQKTFHVLNIAVCKDGVFLVDPTTQHTRKANAGDKIFFLLM